MVMSIGKAGSGLHGFVAIAKPNGSSMKKSSTVGQSRQPSLSKHKSITYQWPEGTKEGDLVRYYDSGWRVGYIMAVEKAGVKIKPIGAYGANPNAIHAIHILGENVERIKE